MRNGLSYSECGRLGALVTKKIIEDKKQTKIAEYNTNPKICICCNRPLPYDKRQNKFCSSSCSAKMSNYKRAVKKKEKNKNCVGCAKQTTNPKFCSNKCHTDYIWNCRKSKIEKEQKIENITIARKYLLETKGHVCEICTTKEWLNKPIPLVCDHIDGDSDNNNLSNLRMICCNCDAQTDFYKGKNRGRGRAYRRQRYAEGKTW